MKKARPTDAVHADASVRGVRREPLAVAEILQLEASLIEVFSTIRHLKAGTPVARHIKYPPLPSLFSESIAIAATPLLFGADWVARYGGRAAALVVENAGRNTKLMVEVKATGQHAFQELKLKDLQADVLIWIRFGHRLELGTGAIEVALIEAPGRYIAGQCRLDVRRFEAVAGIREAQRILRFESL